MLHPICLRKKVRSCEKLLTSESCKNKKYPPIDPIPEFKHITEHDFVWGINVELWKNRSHDFFFFRSPLLTPSNIPKKVAPDPSFQQFVLPDLDGQFGPLDVLGEGQRPFNGRAISTPPTHTATPKCGERDHNLTMLVPKNRNKTKKKQLKQS